MGEESPMKPTMRSFINMKIIVLLLALVALAGLVGCRSAPPHSAWHGFPTIPPMADADASRRHLVSFQVPTVVKAVRDGDPLAVNYVAG